MDRHCFFRHAMNRVWRQARLQLQTKLCLYQTCILLILLHGSEAWILSQEDLWKLKAFHMHCQRMILGIRWYDFVRNAEVIATTNLPSVQDIMTKRRNSLFGHLVRLNDHTPAHRALSQVAAGYSSLCRCPGCPCYSWIQQLGDGTPFGIHAEWSRASRRWNSRLTQRTSAVYAI